MTFQIIADRLHRDGGQVPFVPSPNFGGRMQPVALIVHDTAGPSAVSAINTFKDRASKVSAHVVVDLDGKITQMVEFDRVAWHAGKSVLDGRSGCNNFTIGIEIVNPGILNKDGCAWFTKKGAKGYAGIEHCKTKEHGDGYWLGYPEAQFDAVVDLCQALVKAYPAIKQIVPHWYISPGRKIDTNPLFPLDDLRRAVFEQSAPVAAVSMLEVGSKGPSVEAAQRRLQALGYPVGMVDGIFGSATRTAVLGFEAENGLTIDGKLDGNEMLVLHSDTAKGMPLAHRESVAVSDLSATSESVKDMTLVRNGSAALTVSSAAGGGAQMFASDPSTIDPNSLSKVAEGAGYVETIARVLGSVVTSLGQNFWIVGLVAGGVGLFLYRKLILRRLKEFAEGRWSPSGG